MRNPVVVAVAALVLAACSFEPAAAQTPDTIFVGDHIVTMDPDRPAVDAVAIRDGLITAAGARDAVLAGRGEETRVVELGERALLPGFIDAHGHLLAVGRGLDTLSLHSPPVGDVTDVDGLVRKIRAWIAERDIPPGAVVLGTGYDDSLLAERRHPTRDDLDRASTRHRIVLTHVSGHLRAANSAALEASGITADTPDPPGGYIRRRPGSTEPDGVLEERAGGLVAAGGSAPTAGDLETLARRAIAVYAGYGTTTVQDGSTSPAVARALGDAARRQPFAVDVAVFPRFGTMADAEGATWERTYRGGFRIAGVLRLVSITVNRTTRSGQVLGPHQRATVREALHAVTLGAAYQYFKEDTKGSITVGKQADLVVLDRNPLTADPADLEHIAVLETFSHGRSVYARAREAAR